MAQKNWLNFVKINHSFSMRIKYLVIFLMFPLCSFAQTDMQNLTGLWVKVKAELGDGSTIVDRKGCGMDFLKYNFYEDGFLDKSSDALFLQYKIPYKLYDDTLQIGSLLFHILKLTPDTLSLSFFYVKAEENQKVIYTFAKTQHIRQFERGEFNADVKDTVYKAGLLLFPQVNGVSNYLTDAINGKFEPGEVKISFVVTKRGLVKNYTVLETGDISNNMVKSINRALARQDWIPAKINDQPVNCQVLANIHLKVLMLGTQTMRIMEISYPFLPAIPYPPLDREEAESEQQYFNDASDAFNKQNYSKAVELLGKCVDMDNIDLKAYYLRAEANSKLGKTKEACKDWATLAGLGQVTAAKKLAELCKN
jgi:hypothetical protein